MENKTQKEPKEKSQRLRERQKKLLKKISENIRSDRPKSLTKLAQESGYAISTTQAVGRIVSTKNFQLALRKTGLDEDFIIKEYRKALKEKPNKAITWDVKLKWLQDIIKFLDLVPKEEQGGKWSRIQNYIDKFLMVKVSPEKWAEIKEKKAKGEELDDNFKDIDFEGIEEGQIKETEENGEDIKETKDIKEDTEDIE